MNNYDELVKFRNKITNDDDYVIFEEDCQLLDRVLDYYEKKAELEKNCELLLNVIEDFVFDDEVSTYIEFYKEIFSRYLLKFGRVKLKNNRYYKKEKQNERKHRAV